MRRLRRSTRRYRKCCPAVPLSIAREVATDPCQFCLM